MDRILLITALTVILTACSPVREIEVVKTVNGKQVVTGKIVLGPELRKGGVFFRVKPPEGTYRLAVAGNFNEWDPEAHQLTNSGRYGVWSGFVPIRKKNLKQIEFKYIRNGTGWLVDPHTDHTDDGYGGKNSLFKLSR